MTAILKPIRQHAFWLLAFGLALAHYAYLGNFIFPGVSCPDADAYVIPARQVVETGSYHRFLESPVQYLSRNWFADNNNILYSRYPPGLPSLFALGWLYGQLSGVLHLNVLFASLAVLATVGVARHFVGPTAALAAGGLLAISSSANEQAFALDSSSATVLIVLLAAWQLLSLLKRCQPHPELPASSPSVPALVLTAVAAGLSIGALPTIHYAEGLITVIAVAWAMFAIKPLPAKLGLLAGAAAPLLALAAYNYHAYGSCLSCGYTKDGEAFFFSLVQLSSNYRLYINGIGHHDLCLIFGLGIIGLVALCWQKANNRQGLVLAMCSLPTLVLYMSYYFSDDSAVNRFLGLTCPFAIVGALWLLSSLKITGKYRLLAAVVLLQLLFTVPQTTATINYCSNTLDQTWAIAKAVRLKVPAQALVITQDSIANSLSISTKVDIVDEELLVHTYTPVTQQHTEDLTSRLYQKNWMAAYGGLPDKSRRQLVWQQITAWKPQGQVFWLTNRHELEQYLPAEATIKGLVTIENVSEIPTLNTAAKVLSLKPRARPRLVAATQEAVSKGDLTLWEINLK